LSIFKIWTLKILSTFSYCRQLLWFLAKKKLRNFWQFFFLTKWQIFATKKIIIIVFMNCDFYSLIVTDPKTLTRHLIQLCMKITCFTSKLLISLRNCILVFFFPILWCSHSNKNPKINFTLFDHSFFKRLLKE